MQRAKRTAAALGACLLIFCAGCSEKPAAETGASLPESGTAPESTLSANPTAAPETVLPEQTTQAPETALPAETEAPARPAGPQVLTAMVYTYESSGKEIRTEYEYDDAGRMCAETEHTVLATYRKEYTYASDEEMTRYAYYVNGELSEQTDYTFDERGLLIAVTELKKQRDGDMHPTRREEYAYDENNNRVSECRYLYHTDNGSDVSDLQSRRENTYNENYQLIRSVEYDNYGSPTNWTELEYHDSGMVAKVLRYSDLFDAERQYVSRMETYDEAGNLLLIVDLDEAGTVTEQIARYEYEYDDNGNVIRCTSFADDGSVRTESLSRYLYDDNGNLIQVEVSENGEPMHVRTEYSYDEKGLQTRSFTESHDSYEFSFETLAWEPVHLPGAYETYVMGDNGILRESTEYRPADLAEIEAAPALLFTDTALPYPLMPTRVSTFDEQGRPVSAVIYGNDGSVYARETYLYGPAA